MKKKPILQKETSTQLPKPRKSRKKEKATLNTTRSKDPFLKREQEKYTNPLPSREYILQIMADSGVPMSFNQLVQDLAIMVEEEDWFNRRLQAMVRDGQIMCNRRQAFLLPTRLDLVAGYVIGHADGFGYVRRDDGQPDIFLGPKAMREVLHGDRVMIRVIGTDRRGRQEGAVVEILERKNHHVVGRVFQQHGLLVVVPEDRRICQEILIAPGQRAVKEQTVVVVELLEQPSKYSRPIGKIIKILGSYDDPGIEIEIALRKHDLPVVFPDDVKAQLRHLPREVRKKDLLNREDLRNLAFVTIDGEQAKDFDDAVYCESSPQGFRLFVAIADVSHYVDKGTPLDVEAFNRGNSVYFPRRVIPMLPEKLSNGLCSLMPEKDRLCLVCEMMIQSNGAISHYHFYNAVIHSHARLTYTQVQQMVFDQEPEIRTRFQSLLPSLDTLEQLFQVLLGARKKRGAIEFETTETRIIFNDQQKIERIVPETRTDAHRLIEECMLAANVCASEFLLKKKQDALYRVHHGPSADKLQTLREQLAGFGLTLGGGMNPSPDDFARLLKIAKARPNASILQTMLLRSLSQAVYSGENSGHFGLAYDAYTHFTSPIRRYPDLLVHRAIKACLEHKRLNIPELETVGIHCSQTERRADDASRDVLLWLKCYYMKDKVGEIYTGCVTSVVPFGLFVTLEDLYIEGLVHVSDLGRDYYQYDPIRQVLFGEKSGFSYQILDMVQVQVVRVDLASRKIDLRLVGEKRKSIQAENTSRENRSANTGLSRTPSRKRIARPSVEKEKPTTKRLKLENKTNNRKGRSVKNKKVASKPNKPTAKKRIKAKKI